MKMKRACEATGLTERAIRLYLKNELISPEQVNGWLDFSSADIRQLCDIALLRKMNFSIEQIASMLHNPGVIPETVHLRMQNGRADYEREKEICAILTEAESKCADNIHELAARIRELQKIPSALYFGRFDEISDEARKEEEQAALTDVSRTERRNRRKKGWLAAMGSICILTALVALLLSYTRVSGYISIAPLTVLETNDRQQTVTVCIRNANAIEALGRDTITVPYHFFAEHLEVGKVIEKSCQLAVELTNFDLAQAGIHPLQTIQTRSRDINNAWMKYVLQMLFENGYGEKTVLWLFEPCNLKPLFQPE